jgi:phage gp46-like protein
MTTLDCALSYDPVRRRCDLVFDGTDFALDDTPVTPVLTAVLLDRRAHTDDVLPATPRSGYAPAALNARRGWAGDAIAASDGDLVGSRMWIVGFGKQDEPTRLLAEGALREKLEPLANARNWPMSVLVQWVRQNFLGWRIVVGPATLNFNTAVAP